MSTQKIVVAVVWILSGLGMWLGSGLLVTIATGLFGFLVVAHTIECVVFMKEIREAPGGLANNLVQVFVFGVVHMQELRAGAETPGSEA